MLCALLSMVPSSYFLSLLIVSISMQSSHNVSLDSTSAGSGYSCDITAATVCIHYTASLRPCEGSKLKPACNKLHQSQITHFQQIQNSLARAVKAPKCCPFTPILHSLHWLKITEHIEYELLSLTYKVLTTTQPPYLHNLISVQPPRNTRSSTHVTLARPPTSSSLHVTDRSFGYASPCLWNQLPSSLSTSFQSLCL